MSNQTSSSGIVDQRLVELGLTLPCAASPLFTYVSSRQVGNMLYISGQGPREETGLYRCGKLGQNISTEQGYDDARLAGLQLLAVAKEALGSLDRIESVVKLLGMVNSTPEFGEHPQVINGCSDLLVDVLGEKGRHARSAVGMGSLPNGMTVEVEAIFHISE